MSRRPTLRIFLDDDLAQALRDRSTALKVSRSELAREVLNIGLAAINDQHDEVELRETALRQSFDAMRARAARRRGQPPAPADDDVPY